jgi:prepilin-type N-terminal cleavage/methylation domain-containing protein
LPPPRNAKYATIMLRSHRSNRGFTLIELLTAIAIIFILAMLLLPVISSLRARAQRAQCMANLRTLHAAVELFIQQNGNWPQINVAQNKDKSSEQLAQLWIAALKPFGVSQRSWICPTIQELMRDPDYSNLENMRIDYFATSFDDKPTTPHQWPRQPWFVESADVHGHGNLIVFTDGSISDLETAKRSSSAAK